MIIRKIRLTEVEIIITLIVLFIFRKPGFVASRESKVTGFIILERWLCTSIASWIVTPEGKGLSCVASYFSLA